MNLNEINNFFIKSCMNGWKGESCDECIISEGCLHGSCNSADECICQAGWTGELCNQCIPSPTCIHGTCQSAFECNCEVGWTGHNCDESMTHILFNFLLLVPIAMSNTEFPM